MSASSPAPPGTPSTSWSPQVPVVGCPSWKAQTTATLWQSLGPHLALGSPSAPGVLGGQRRHHPDLCGQGPCQSWARPPRLQGTACPGYSEPPVSRTQGRVALHTPGSCSLIHSLARAPVRHPARSEHLLWACPLPGPGDTGTRSLLPKAPGSVRRTHLGSEQGLRAWGWQLVVLGGWEVPGEVPVTEGQASGRVGPPHWTLAPLVPSGPGASATLPTRLPSLHPGGTRPSWLWRGSVGLGGRAAGLLAFGSDLTEEGWGGEGEP